MASASGSRRLLTSSRIELNFPRLAEKVNFEFTSPHTYDYNCVAWADNKQDDWTQFYDNQGNLILAAGRYIQHFLDQGFFEIDNGDFELGEQKVAIYINSITGHFKHVARQLENGRWTSKLGDWEDIEHTEVGVLLGPSYGDTIVFLGRHK
jgi:hypothetical protein